MHKIGSIVSTNIKVFLTYSTYIITCLILLTLFIENFVFSSGFDVLRFREIDDVAFQESLRRLHLSISTGHFRDLLVINDYAYGWIFWFPLALLTFPLYWMSTHFGIDWPLITAPRQMSLAFGIMTLFLIRKILKKYATPEWATAIAILMLTLFPTFGYFSLRFGTVNEVMFFATLSFYLAIAEDHSTPKGRKQVIIALALAGGVKLSGLLIAPLICALIAIRYHYKSATMLARDFILASIAFVLLLVFFSNPALYAAPFKHEIAESYFSTLTYFIAVTKLGAISTSPTTIFYDAFMSSVPNCICISILFLGLVARALTQKNKRFDFVAIMGALLLSVFYLIHSVNSGIGAALYFTSISFLLVLGTTYWSSARCGVLILAVITLLQFIDLKQRASAQYNSNTLSFNHLAYYILKHKSKNTLNQANHIVQCIGATEKIWSKHVFIDFTIPTGLNALSYPNACISIAWNNLSASNKGCGTPVDYIVLDKRTPRFLSTDIANKNITKLDQKLKNDLLMDSESRNAIITGNVFDGRHFKKICDLETVQVFSAE